MEDLKDKHARGVQERDDPDRAPTGEPYRQIQHQQQRIQQARAAQAQQERHEEVQRIHELKQIVAAKQQQDEEDEDSASDDDEQWLDDLESDPTLEAIREKRLAELKQEHQTIAAQKAKGHGEYRTIAQDDFLPECNTTDSWVVVHFYHEEFEKCKVMDFHLKSIAPQHLECKFLRLSAEKAPFFCTKLKIQTLPTLMVFYDGQAKDRLVGFEGLVVDGESTATLNEWPTSSLLKWLGKVGAIDYSPSRKAELEEEMKRLGISSAKKSVWRGGSKTYEDEEEYYEMCGR